MATHFFSMFWGREDVYANRGKNGGYFPQCDNRWNELWKSTLLLIILRKRYKIFLSVFQQSRIIVATVMKVFSAKERELIVNAQQARNLMEELSESVHALDRYVEVE